MDSVSINQFHDRYQPLKVVGNSGADFIVISAEDWEQDQETLYVLQNTDLTQQIAKSFATNANSGGYHPSTQEIDEILSI